MMVCRVDMKAPIVTIPKYPDDVWADLKAPMVTIPKYPDDGLPSWFESTHGHHP